MTDHCKYSPQQLSSLIRSLRKQIFHAGPQPSNDIGAIEERFQLSLPKDYKQFLGNYGSLRSGSLAILGLGDREKIGRSVADLTLVLRLRHPSFPQHVIPIEILGDSRFACLICSLAHDQFGHVVEVDLQQLGRPIYWPLLSTCFRDYVYERLKASAQRERSTDQDAWVQFEQHVVDYQKRYEYGHAKGGKLPRNHEWRPYRYCIQDVVFGVTVVRHSRGANCLLVDVFLTAEIPQYDPLAGATALTSFLLSEAYKCGGTMEIRFTNNVESGQVPAELQALARRHQIQFAQARQGQIEAAEAKALYAAITNFSQPLQQKINVLERMGRIKMARACYVVHHGVWTREQVEMIVLGSEYPDSVLGGMAQPHQRHRYQHDLLQARSALLGGMLDRILTQRERVAPDGRTYDMEDDVRSLAIDFDDSYYAKRYHCEEDVSVPWLYPEQDTLRIPGGLDFHVLIRARDAADMREHIMEDIDLAAQLRNQTEIPTFVVVPYDFSHLDEIVQKQVLKQAQVAQIGILICPETVLTFDSEAAQKLARSRILRQ